MGDVVLLMFAVACLLMFGWRKQIVDSVFRINGMFVPQNERARRIQESLAGIILLFGALFFLAAFFGWIPMATGTRYYVVDPK